MESVSGYNRPPVVERVASVYAEIPEELFEERFPDWENVVRAEFPIYEPLTEWLISVDNREGVPLFDTAHPELKITHRFSRKPSKEGFDWSIRCPSGQFTMNMHSRRSEEATRRYKNLRSEFSKWLQLWLRHFDVQNLKTLSLHYVNILNRDTVPDFFTDHNSLVISRILKVFSNIPGDHECILPPYSCKVNLKLNGRDNSFALIELSDYLRPPLPAVKLDLIVNSDISQVPNNADDLLELMDWCHERNVDRFNALFTEEAKTTFGPIFE